MVKLRSFKLLKRIFFLFSIIHFTKIVLIFGLHLKKTRFYTKTINICVQNVFGTFLAIARNFFTQRSALVFSFLLKMCSPERRKRAQKPKIVPAFYRRIYATRALFSTFWLNSSFVLWFSTRAKPQNLGFLPIILRKTQKMSSPGLVGCWNSPLKSYRFLDRSQ